ncbi:type II toxin-antitoxin system HicB family antitoxin [Scytonema sp. HK-05]
MKIKVVLEPSDEGGYTVYVPSLPGCISEGETLEEAVLQYPRGNRTLSSTLGG